MISYCHEQFPSLLYCGVLYVNVIYKEYLEMVTETVNRHFSCWCHHLYDFCVWVISPQVFLKVCNSATIIRNLWVGIFVTNDDVQHSNCYLPRGLNCLISQALKCFASILARGVVLIYYLKLLMCQCCDPPSPSLPYSCCPNTPFM